MKTSSEETLEKFLTALEKKRKKVWIAKGIAEFALILFATLGLASLLAHIYSNNTYFYIIKLASVLVLCLSFLKFVLFSILKKEEKAKLSMEFEKISPGLGEDTLNAFLLTSDLSKREDELGISKKLIEAHIERVSQKLKLFDLSPAVPKIKEYWLPLIITVVLTTGTLISAPKGFISFLFSTHFLPESLPDLLELADIEIEYKYPAYTKLPYQIVRGSTGDLKAIKGTHVIFRANTIKKLDSGELSIEKGIVTPLIIEGTKINTEFIILSNGSFVIQNKGGKLRSRNFNILSEEDKNPRVHIESTSKEIKEFGGKENLDIFYKAEDDFGLTKLLLIIKTKKGEMIKPIEQMRDEPKSTANKFTWDFSTVDSEPGEVIEAMIYAYDNDIISGPKLGVSNVIKIKLNDSRKNHENTLTSLEDLLDKLVDTLADEIENHHPDYKNISSTKAVQDEISAKIEKIVNSLNKILENIKEDDLSDYTYFLGLSKMKTRVDDLLDKRLDIISSLSVNKLSRLDGLISEEINEFEDDILFIDSLLKGEKIKESLLYGRETLSRYHELSELLKNLKGNGNEETRKEIEKKIKDLRNLTSQLAQKLASINVNSPDVHLNPDAFNSLDLQQKLDEIMNLINQGEIDKALGLLTQVGNNLQQMIASLESGYHSFTSASLSKEIKELNDIISNIKDLEKSEKSLNEKTEKLKNSLLKEPSNEGNLNKFVEREKKKLKMFKNLIMGTRAKFSSPLDKNEFVENHFLIEKILSDSNELKHRLESFEINEALRQSEDLEEQTIRLRNLSDLQMGSYANASREVQSSSELAREIKEDIEGFLREGENKESMGELARKQGEIEKGTSRLISKMNELSEDNFLYSPKIGKNLNESKSFMEGSSNDLHSTEISKAISNQREALMALKQAREEANKLLETYQLSAKGMGMPAPFLFSRKEFQDGIHGVDTSYVDIPSAEEFKEGREFKENLLKSIKEGSPEGFSELNKNYYERIIK